MRLLLLRTYKLGQKEKLKYVLQWIHLFLNILFLEPNDQQPDRRV